MQIGLIIKYHLTALFIAFIYSLGMLPLGLKYSAGTFIFLIGVWTLINMQEPLEDLE